MSEKTKEVPQLSDATYAHTLVIKSDGTPRLCPDKGSWCFSIESVVFSDITS